MLHPILSFYLATLFISSTSSSTTVNETASVTRNVSESALAIRQTFTHTNHVAFDAQTYLQLVENSNIFLDKSLLIKKILNLTSKIILITSPRKWGKSVNLNMIKTFLDIQVDQTGAPISSNSRRRLFEYGEITTTNGRIEKLNNPLLISNCTYLFEKYQGKYPVINLNFSRLNGIKYEHVVEDIRSRIRNAFNEHIYMKEILKKTITTEDKNISSMVKKEAENNFQLFSKIIDQTANDTDVLKSLKMLSEILYKHFNQKVFVLVDDYDGILNPLLDPRITEDDETNLISFYTSLISDIFSENRYLEKCILTGTTDIRHLLNNLEVECKYVTVITTDLDSFYGYSDEEVEEIFDVLEVPEEDRARGHDWYTGYGIQEDDNLTKTLILYNPSFFSSFICDRKIKNHKLQYPNEFLLNNIFKYKRFRSIFIYLINAGYEFYEFSDLRLDIDSVSLIRDVLDSNSTLKMSKEIEDVIKSYLGSLGYLASFSDISMFAMGNLPNNHIRNEVSSELMNHYIRKYSIPPAILTKTIQSLIQAIETDRNSTETLQSSFQNLIDRFPLFDDLSKDSKEKYHDEVTNENFLRFVFFFLATRISLLTNIRSEIPSPFTKPVVMFRFKRRRIALDLMVNDHQHLPELLRATKDHPVVSDPGPDIDVTKFIVMKIDSKKKVHVAVNITVGVEPTTCIPIVPEMYSKHWYLKYLKSYVTRRGKIV